MNKCKLGDLFYIKQGYAFKSEKYVSHSNYILCTLANFSESNNFKFSSEKATYYPDEFSHDLILDAGEHEFTMGLSGKAGNAWGFCCRFIDMSDVLTVETEKCEFDNLPIFI